MVTRNTSRRDPGFLSTDLMVAMAILGLALVPLTLSLLPQQRLATHYYERAVLLELMDGELEVLQAGAWRTYGPGRHPYAVAGEAAHSLPQGSFELLVTSERLRLEWTPVRSSGRQRAVIAREVLLR